MNREIERKKERKRREGEILSSTKIVFLGFGCGVGVGMVAGNARKKKL